MFLFIIGQSMIWFQTNGQFIWPWFRNNPIIVSVVGGSTISYIFIYATGMVVHYYDGQLWPSRFIGFAMGMIAFTILTYTVMGEPMTAKTIISLMLACLLMCVQIFWK